MFKDFFKMDIPSVIKIKQRVLLGVLAFIVIGFITFLILWMDDGAKPSFANHDVKAKEIESSGTSIKPEELWRYQMEGENKKLNDAIKEIKEALTHKNTHDSADKDETIQVY